jgi:hypothetical protein
MGRGWWFVGVDLGQSQDFTAIAALERSELMGEYDPAMCAWRKEVALRLRYLERVPLGTPYPDIVERVRRTTTAPELDGRCHVAVDATGVGRPVVDLLRRADLGGTILPAIFTSGAAESLSKGYYGVPKRDLVTGLQVLLQRGGLEIAAGLKHASELVEELAGMRVKVGGEGREQYGAWREGMHDDLVFAVALAYWAARKMYPGEPSGENAYWRFRAWRECEREFGIAAVRGRGLVD